MSDVTQDEEDCYPVKHIWFGVLRVGIILQEGNGPCPIIAIANALFLRGALSLPSAQRSISHPSLVALLTTYAYEINVVPSNASEEVAANITANLAASIRVLNSSAMRHGMDINCSLTDVTSFEYTKEISLFDIFRLRPLHGWVASPEDEELYEFFSGRTYNQVQDVIARLQETLVGSATSTITRDDEEDEDEICAGPIRRRPSNGVNSAFDNGTASQAALAGAWFVAHSTQLTPHGLHCLKDALGESEIAVLFRNNHYNTVIKHEGQLYTLVSPAGVLHCPRFVFQKLTIAGADIEAFDGSFVPLSNSYQSAEAFAASGTSQDTEDEVQSAPVLPEGADAPNGMSDEEFAKMLASSDDMDRRRQKVKQEEIDRRYARKVQAIYNSQSSALPNVSQTARDSTGAVGGFLKSSRCVIL